ncbi:MAG TPA: anti-sigma factor [Pyrinomonadaceae bacterium]|nr:anti-sigma factor [Pyrinomonadaceae bacterium]
MRHEDYKELLALEATGALEAGERRALEAHLPSCAECRAELRELSDAVATLAFTVAPVAPPARLRARVLESVRAVDPSEMRAVDPSEVFAQGKAVGDGPNLRRAPGAGDENADDWRSVVKRFGLWQLLTASPSLSFGAAVAAIAFVLLGATTLFTWSRTRTLQGEVARLSEHLKESQAESARAREQVAGMRAQLSHASEMSDVMASPGALVERLAGKGVAPQAHALVAYDHSTGRAVLVASGLPPAPDGKAYQLWLIADKKPMPGGTFKTDADGRARMSDRLPPGMTQPAFAVTLEREGGETAPKGEMYLLGNAS